MEVLADPGSMEVGRQKEVDGGSLPQKDRFYHTRQFSCFTGKMFFYGHPWI